MRAGTSEDIRLGMVVTLPWAQYHAVMTERAGAPCPLPASHDKLDEAHYFLHQVFESLHQPDQLRWNLNAFLQALRSVDHLLRDELDKAGEAAWYTQRRTEFRSDVLLSRFKAGRDLVVHRGVLTARSTAHVGVFRGRHLKLAMPMAISLDQTSAELLSRVVAINIELGPGSVFVDEAHSAIGEQMGVQRRWIVAELDDAEEAPVVCHRAWARLNDLVRQAHMRLGAEAVVVPAEPEGPHDVRLYNVLLESDVDPSLPKKWGW